MIVVDHTCKLLSAASSLPQTHPLPRSQEERAAMLQACQKGGPWWLRSRNVAAPRGAPGSGVPNTLNAVWQLLLLLSRPRPQLKIIAYRTAGRPEKEAQRAPQQIGARQGHSRRSAGGSIGLLCACSLFIDGVLFGTQVLSQQGPWTESYIHMPSSFAAGQNQAKQAANPFDLHGFAALAQKHA